MPVFIRSAFSTGKIKIIGSGNQKRSFVHNDDVSRAITHLLTTDFSGVFNITNQNNNVRIIDLANLVKRYLNPDLVIQTSFDKTQDEDWQFSVEKTRLIGFEADIDLERYFRSLTKRDKEIMWLSANYDWGSYE